MMQCIPSFLGHRYMDPFLNHVTLDPLNQSDRFDQSGCSDLYDYTQFRHDGVSNSSEVDNKDVDNKIEQIRIRLLLDSLPEDDAPNVERIIINHPPHSLFDSPNFFQDALNVPLKISPTVLPLERYLITFSESYIVPVAAFPGCIDPLEAPTIVESSTQPSPVIINSPTSSNILPAEDMDVMQSTSSDVNHSPLSITIAQPRPAAITVPIVSESRFSFWGFCHQFFESLKTLCKNIAYLLDVFWN